MVASERLNQIALEAIKDISEAYDMGGPHEGCDEFDNFDYEGEIIAKIAAKYEVGEQDLRDEVERIEREAYDTEYMQMRENDGPYGRIE